MPGTSFITNPFGAHRTVSDFTTFQDDDGHDLFYGQGEVYSLRANAAITKGQVLEFVAATTTVPLSVTPAPSGMTAEEFAGVSLHDAAADEQVQFVRRGFVVVQHDPAAASVAFGSVATAPVTVTGAIEAAAAATTGDVVLGSVLSSEIGTTNTAFMLVDPSIIPQTA